MGTLSTRPGRLRRPTAYCTRPTAMPTAARPKPKWKPIVDCRRPVSSGPEERAEVDAEVVERETGVATRVALGVQGADEGRGRGLEPARAQRDRTRPTPTPATPGISARRDVPEHHDRGAGEQGALGAEQTVGDPRAEDRREVDATAVRADDRRRRSPDRCRGRPRAPSRTGRAAGCPACRRTRSAPTARPRTGSRAGAAGRRSGCRARPRQWSRRNSWSSMVPYGMPDRDGKAAIW